MAVLSDPALGALALLLFALGAAPALMAFISSGRGLASACPAPDSLPVAVVPVGAAAAARIAEVHGLVPVTGVAWGGRAWSVQVEDGRGRSLAATVCPWSGRIDAARSW